MHQVYAVIMKSVHKMTNVTLGEDSLREFDYTAEQQCRRCDSCKTVDRPMGGQMDGCLAVA